MKKEFKMVKLFEDVLNLYSDNLNQLSEERRNRCQKLKHFVNSENKLNEANIKDLIDDSKSTDAKRIELSNTIYSVYKGVDSDGTLLFESDSQTRSGIVHKQRIFYEGFFNLLDKVDENEEITEGDVINILTGDVYIDCNCESHLYWGFAYKAFKNDYGLRKETREPKKNNVSLNGSACKHALSVLELINQSNTLYEEIAKDLNVLFQKYKKRSKLELR